MPGRDFVGATGYRYGFNGKEKDDEMKGSGNSYDFDSRIYDSRIGRWLTVDKLQLKYPSESPYSFASNSPIYILDQDGNVVVPFILANKYQGKAYQKATYELCASGSIFGKVYHQLQASSNIYTVSSGAVPGRPSAGGVFISTPVKFNLQGDNAFQIKLTLVNKRVEFEEFFHAGQAEFGLIEKGNQLLLETEARVALAYQYSSTPKSIAGNELEGEVYRFANDNKAYFEKLKKGESISKEEEQKFRSNVKNLAANQVAPKYDKSFANDKKIPIEQATMYRDQSKTYEGETPFFDSLTKGQKDETNNEGTPAGATKKKN